MSSRALFFRVFIAFNLLTRQGYQHQHSTSVKGVLRLRILEQERKSFLTHKGSGSIGGAISRVQETEQEIDFADAQRILADPDALLHDPNTQARYDIVDKIRALYPSMEHLKCLGGFDNLRREFTWENHKLELDHTSYEFGDLFEIEIETNEPELIKQKLCKLLQENNVDYAESAKSKFARFITKKLE